MEKRDTTTMTPSRPVERQTKKRGNAVLLPHSRKDWIVGGLVVAEIVVRQIRAGEGEGDVWICETQHPTRRTITFPSCSFGDCNLRVHPVHMLEKAFDFDI